MKCEICGLRSDICVRHHIQSRSLGGTNHKNNLSILCPNCHSLVHQGHVIIEGKFASTSGELQLVWRKEEQSPKVGVEEPDVYIQRRSNDKRGS